VTARLMSCNQFITLMKNIVAFVFVLLAIGHVNASGVKPDSPVGISVIKKGAVVKLFYRGEQSGKVKVTIYDEDGKVVFTETHNNTEHFMRPYNFSSLPAGNYTIELSDEQGKRFKKVTHSWKTEIRSAHLTRLNDNENKYMLAVPNKGQDALTVRIYDHNYKQLYQETEIINGNFAKVYNLRWRHGPHIFEITDQKGKTNRFIE